MGFWLFTMMVGADRVAPVDDRNATIQGDLRIAPTPIKRKPLGGLIGAFKTVSTKQINLLRDTKGQVVWQRNYYERIIRDEREMDRIHRYIESNSSLWAEDEETPRMFIIGRGGRDLPLHQIYSDRHFIPRSTFESAPCSFLLHAAPLLEEKWDVGSQALIPKIRDPFVLSLGYDGFPSVRYNRLGRFRYFVITTMHSGLLNHRTNL